MKTLIIGGHFDGQVTSERGEAIELHYVVKDNVSIDYHSALKEVDCSYGSQIYVRERFTGNNKSFHFYMQKDLKVDNVIEMLFNKYKEKN